MTGMSLLLTPAKADVGSSSCRCVSSPGRPRDQLARCRPGREWLRHPELAGDDLERECRQRAGRRAVDHGSFRARIIVREVHEHSSSFSPCPSRRLHSRHADRSPNKRPPRRLRARGLRRERRGVEPQQQHLVQSRTISNKRARRIHRPGQHLRAVERDIARPERSGLFAVQGDQKVAWLRPFLRGLGARAAGGSGPTARMPSSEIAVTSSRRVET